MIDLRKLLLLLKSLPNKYAGAAQWDPLTDGAINTKPFWQKFKDKYNLENQ